MFLNTWHPLFPTLVLCGLSGFSCGARSGVEIGDAGVDAAQTCVTDLDCNTGDACAPAECREGVCAPLPVKVCDDHDECTSDSCDPASAKCVFTPRTLDLDGDGHKSPLPGFTPGSPGSCGDDCDDRSAAAHPGGIEVCDGVDNDCNGQIDEGAAYGGASLPVRVSSQTFDRAARGGLAFDGTRYGVSYSGHQTRWSSFFKGLARNGSTVVNDASLTDINSETYAGSLLHNGSYFASAWEDARQDGNYEVYFNRFDSNGKKLAADLRVTNAPNFSLHASLVWNGTESLMVWDDRRFETGDGNDVRLFGQRIGFDGKPVGGNLSITEAGVLAEYPSIAIGQKKLGIVFTSQVENDVQASFITTDAALGSPSTPITIGTTNVQGPSLVAMNGRFLAAWERYGQGGSGSAIYGAVVDENGTILEPAQPLTFGASFARSFSLLSFGDRVLLVWADDHDGNYELYWETLDSTLRVLTPRVRLTTTPSDTLDPVAAFGPSGDIGVLYDDWSTGSRQAYFIGMGCFMGKTAE